LDLFYNQNCTSDLHVQRTKYPHQNRQNYYRVTVQITELLVTNILHIHTKFFSRESQHIPQVFAFIYLKYVI